MSARNTFTQLIKRMLRFYFVRPLQRFNVANRAEKHLGSEAPKFKLAPHHHQQQQLPWGENEETRLLSKEREQQQIESEKKLSEIAKHIKVTQTIERIENPMRPHEIDANKDDNQKSMRPLPVAHNMRFDLKDIWYVERVPYGRLDIDRVEEIMLNRLANPDYWTPKVIADNYKLSLDHAIKLERYVKPLRLHVSPRIAKNLEITGRNNELFQRIKEYVVVVDESLRSEYDKQFDDCVPEPQKSVPELGSQRLNDMPALHSQSQRIEDNNNTNNQSQTGEAQVPNAKAKRMLASARDKLQRSNSNNNKAPIT